MIAISLLIASLVACSKNEQAIIGIENPEIPTKAVGGIKQHDI